MPPPHQQPPVASVTPPQPYLPPQPQPPPPSRPEKLSSLPRSAIPPPATAPNPGNGMDTVIRELLPQQQPRTIERRDLQYITISKEELSSDSLSPDPWKRDAREKAEKQQQLHIVDLLDKEIQELQAKPERTAEESDRLRKLMLEWQFQKRLQESKQSDEDEEEEDDEDVDTMMIMQRLEAEKRARLQDEERRRKQQLEEIRKREAEERAKQEEERRWREEERNKREAEEKRRQEEEYYARLEAERRRQHDEAQRKLLTPDEPAGSNSYTGNSAGIVGLGEVYNDPRDKWTKSQEQENSIPSAPPESMTFRERQRLFSQGKEVSNKVKASRKLMELENELNTKQ